MTQSKLPSWLAAVLVAAAPTACGGNVAVSSSGGGDGGSGDGGSGAATTTGSPTGTGGDTGGSGAGGNTGGTGGIGGGGWDGCEGRGHVDCVAAFPECAPVYDDECCPSCDPSGGCSDCINLQFHHCATWNTACGVSGPSCGFVTEWGCTGMKPPCDAGPGGSIEPCGTQPGCVPAYCPEDKDCTTDPVCTPVTGGMCFAICAKAPPPCPAGTEPESDGDCWTGACIPQELCPPTP